MDAAVPFTLLALLVFVAGTGLFAAAIGFMVGRRRNTDELSALRDEVERLRRRIERIENRGGPPSDAIKE
jgi:hypothetical protein